MASCDHFTMFAILVVEKPKSRSLGTVRHCHRLEGHSLPCLYSICVSPSFHPSIPPFSLSLFLSLSISLSLTHTHSLTHSLTHTLSFSLSLSPTHTHTLSLSHSLSLSLPLPPCLPLSHCPFLISVIYASLLHSQPVSYRRLH